MERLGDGGAVDYNLPEDFAPKKLEKLLADFARGGQGSVATFTVADPKTLAGAQQFPDDYNLVRVRMGGWSEFFVTLFPAHQKQHRRRPLYIE
jgi:pyruvate-formate lyase